MPVQTRRQKNGMNRILFERETEDCLNGHAITDLRWFAIIQPESGLWLHLDLFSEGDDVVGTEDNPGYLQYDSGHLSSIEWDHRGFLVGTEAEPFDLNRIGEHTFHVDPLPAPAYEDRAFGMYLNHLHEDVANHQIRISRQEDSDLYDLDWSGQIGLGKFRKNFWVRSNKLQFAGIPLPDTEREDEASWRAQARRFFVDADALLFVTDEKGRRFLAP